MVHRLPLISVGLPVYNGEDFIDKALDSILSQTCRDLEIIISDNASTDRTAQICKAYAERDSRISYHRSEKNLGAAWNYNRVFALSTGKYFKWASHDDLCDSSYLQKCVDILEGDPSVVLCYANTTVIDSAGTPTDNQTEELHLPAARISARYKKFNQRFLSKYKCNAVFGVMRRDALQATDLIGNYEASDIILLAELSLRGKLYEIPEYLFFRRDHPEMSGRANPTPKSIAAWFDPANQQQLVMPMSRLFIEHIRAINRVPMNAVDRARCYKQLGIFLRWKRREMTQETRQLLYSSIYRVPRPSRLLQLFKLNTSL